MRVWLKPDRLAALNISPSEVRAGAGQQQLSVRGWGDEGIDDLRQPDRQHRSADRGGIPNLVVRAEGRNTIVRLKDVADVELGAETYDEDVRFSGEKATFMGIWVLPTANSLDVIKAVRGRAPRDQAAAARRECMSVFRTTRPEYINDALHEVTHTLIETLIIVVCVIFLFLGSLRSVLIPVVAIPISLIGAAFLMLVFGFTPQSADPAGHRAFGRAGGG